MKVKLTDLSAVIHRQLHPRNYPDGSISSAAFSDVDLSVDYGDHGSQACDQSRYRSPEDAWRFHRVHRRRESAATCTIVLSSLDQLGYSCFTAETTAKDGTPDLAHCEVDFSSLGHSALKKVARLLKGFATVTYEPSGADIESVENELQLARLLERKEFI